jgi:hypothetical protein
VLQRVQAVQIAHEDLQRNCHGCRSDGRTQRLAGAFRCRVLDPIFLC